MKIQKPTKGRVVFFTAYRGHDEKDTDEYTALITNTYPSEGDGTVVDLVTFGSASFYFQPKVKFNSDGVAGSWRYPPFEKAEIEV